MYNLKRGATSTCEQEWRSSAKHATTFLLVSLAVVDSDHASHTTPCIIHPTFPPSSHSCVPTTLTTFSSLTTPISSISKRQKGHRIVRMYSISSVIALVVSTLALPALAQNGPNGNLTSLTGTWASGAKNVLTGSVGGILNVCWIRILTSFDERASPTRQTKPSHTHRRLVYRTPCTSAPHCVLACSRLTIVCQYR